MIDPSTGAGLILALIPLFQRERDKSRQASKEEFYEWLLDHKFQEVKDCITQNHTLMSELESLLQVNQEVLLTRFNELDTKLYAILEGMEEFREIAKVIRCQDDTASIAMSDQAKTILIHFQKSNGERLCKYAQNSPYYPDLYIDGKGSGRIKILESRYLDDDLKTLCDSGFINHTGTDCTGEESYTLTRLGATHAKDLCREELSEQGIGILSQFVDSNSGTMNVLKGPEPILMTDNNTSIEITDARLLAEDLGQLHSQGYISMDKITNKGICVYTLKRKGIDYAKSRISH